MWGLTKLKARIHDHGGGNCKSVNGSGPLASVVTRLDGSKGECSHAMLNSHWGTFLSNQQLAAGSKIVATVAAACPLDGRDLC